MSEQAPHYECNRNIRLLLAELGRCKEAFELIHRHEDDANATGEGDGQIRITCDTQIGAIESVRRTVETPADEFRGLLNRIHTAIDEEPDSIDACERVLILVTDALQGMAP